MDDRLDLTHRSLVSRFVAQDANPETATRIFVTFTTTDAAARAREKFEGRYFAGRRIHAVLYDDARLLAQDYTG